MLQMELAARAAGHSPAPDGIPSSKEERRKLRAQGRIHRAENPDKYLRKKHKCRQSKPGMHRF